MTTARPVLVLATLVFALISALAGVAFAQDASPAGVFKLGVVDIDRVQAEYGEVKNAAEMVDRMESSLVANLQLRMRHKLLSAQELDELAQLSAMDKPADKDKTRLEELQKRSSDQAALLESLRSKKELSDQEKASLKELTDIDGKSTAEIAALRAQYAGDVQAKQRELLDSLTDKINVAVAALAQEKGITAVVAKELVLFGGADLTDELLVKLNGQDTKK